MSKKIFNVVMAMLVGGAMAFGQNDDMPPAVQAIVKPYDKGVGDLKKNAVSQLEKLQKQYEGTKNEKGLASVKAELARIKGESIVEKDADGKEEIANLNDVLEGISIPKGAKKVTVSASSYDGVELGKFNKGDKIEIGYVSGEWTGRGGMVNPNIKESATAKSIIMNIDKKGNRNYVTTIPLNTDKTPYIYKIENTDKFFLRINDGLNEKNLLSANGGEITYWYRKVK